MAERRVHTTRPKPRVVRLAVVLMSFAVLVGAVLVWLRSEAPPEFAIYRQRMVGKALRSYSMDFESPDPEKVRAYLAAQKSQSDFVLPEGLQKAQLVGCVALTWQGRPAVMICFRSERPLAAGQSSDLWLFVGDDKVIPRAPANAATAVMEVNGAMTASWKRAGKVYVLVAEGDQSFIRNYL